MKLCRVGEPGLEKPAIIDKDDKIRDLSTIVSDLNPKTLNFETIDKINSINLNDPSEGSRSLIAEIKLYDVALNDTDRTKIATKLMQKYNL